MVVKKTFDYEDIESFILAGPREEDDTEAIRACGLTLKEALQISVDNSEYAYSLWHDGDIFAVYGVGFLGDTAYPWLTATNRIYEDKIKHGFLKTVKKTFQEWFSIYNKFENVYDPRHSKSVEFIKWLGFNVDETQDIKGPFGHKLGRFWR